jgi:hypothetical protein
MATRVLYSSIQITSKLKPYHLNRPFSTALKAKSNLPSDIDIVGGDGSGRIVVLGTGWAGFNLALNLKSDSSTSPEVRIVSPSNHFVFTPLLPSTAVGTLEFRCIQVKQKRKKSEPYSHNDDIHFFVVKFAFMETNHVFCFVFILCYVMLF